MQHIICDACGGRSLEHKSVKLNVAAGLLEEGEKKLRLNGKQLELLEILFTCYPRTVTKDFILNSLYLHDADQPKIKIIDVFVCKLRKRLEGFNIKVLTIYSLGLSLIFLDEEE